MSYKQTIWNYLKNKIGNEYGVAGLMGNLQAEGDFRPNNLENSYEQSTGWTDTTYTNAVNNGSYTKSQFTNDAFGYGLAQWTYYTRKQALYEMWKSGSYSGIDDIDLQLDYLWYELQTDYASVLSVLKSATSIRQASDKVLHDFENPADQSTSVEVYRESLGQTIYNEFSGTGGSGETYKPQLDETGIEGNPWYYEKNPFYQAGYGLPNCTCYAWGRQATLLDEAPSQLSLGDAGDWYSHAVSIGDKVGQTPKLGAVLCMGYEPSGHVAIVEVINSDGSIVISESAYNGTFFWTETVYPSNNYLPQWAINKNATFQGFIYLDKEFNGGGSNHKPILFKKRQGFKFVLYAEKLRRLRNG